MVGWVILPLYRSLVKAFFYHLEVTGNSQRVTFDEVKGVVAYIPMVKTGSPHEKFICCTLLNVRKEHLDLGIDDGEKDGEKDGKMEGRMEGRREVKESLAPTVGSPNTHAHTAASLPTHTRAAKETAHIQNKADVSLHKDLVVSRDLSGKDHAFIEVTDPSHQ